MVKNFFKIALRNILRDKYYTSINVFGLAIGLASSLLIYSYVQQQLSYDDFHPDVDHMYRVNQTAIWNPDGGIMSPTCIPLAGKLLEDYPEIKETLRINPPPGQIIRYEDHGEFKAFYEDRILAVDSNFFSFFGFPLKVGDPREVLKGKNKAVLSEDAAKKIFGDSNPIGKTLLIGDEKIPAEITGIAGPQPDNAHFHFDYLLSIQTNPAIEEFEWSWIWTQIVTYIKVAPGTDVAALEKKFTVMAGKYVAPTLAKFGIDYNDFMKGKDEWNFYLQPVRSIHLHSEKEGNRLGPVSSVRYVYIFSAVAFFVLLLAVINFINLSTARGANRAKEVGVKKTLGAGRRYLIFQFQFESILLTTIATVLGLGIMELLRILISSMLTVELPFSILDSRLLWLVPLMVIAVGLLAGIYPSLYLTAFRPANVLKGRISLGLKKSGLRNALVVLQFAVSISFIVSTVIVYQQLKYFNEKDIGFNRNNVLVINHVDKLGDHLEAFRNEIAKDKGVANAAISSLVPGRGALEDIFFKEGDDKQYPLTGVKVDENFLTLMDMHLVSGRNFEEGRMTDHDAVILNETAAHMFGWDAEEALGKRIVYLGDDVGPQEVIGVVKDFNFQSLYTAIAPLVYLNRHSGYWQNEWLLSIRFSGENVQSIVNDAEKKWDNLVPDAPFDFSFLDDEWANKYHQEKTLGGLFAVFTGLSIVIAVMGLVGLVTYSSEQRKKEIGIRKAFGASVGQMVVMLNTNFTKLIVISFVVAVPVSWYALQQWLDQYPYRIDIGAGAFLISGIAIMVITWLTVSYQSLRAAMTNPTDVLKEE